MNEFTTAEVTQAAQQVVADFGREHYYTREAVASGGVQCFYSTRDGHVGCFVGAVIKQLDPAAFDRLHYEEFKQSDAPESVGSAGVVGNPYNGYINLPIAARAALTVAQDAQDAGYNWGVALGKYLDALDEFEVVASAGEFDLEDD